MKAAWLLYLLIKLAPVMWPLSIGLAIWRWGFGAADSVGSLVVVTAHLATTGTICWAMRRYRSDTAGLLFHALMATPPQQKPHLRALRDPAATPSATLADQESAV